MRILFLQSLTYPFIGLMSLSAVLKKRGHETRLQILNMARPSNRDLDRIKAFMPDVVGVPVYTGWQKNVLTFCRELKRKMDVVVVLGGPHPTHCPEVLRGEGVDFICVGEGETAFPELLKRIEEGGPTDDVPGIWLKRGDKIIDNGPSDLPQLQDLPPMDIDLYCEASEAIRLQDNREFSLNRGCPFQCTYCNGPSLKLLYGSSIVRSKSVEQAMEELHYVNEKYPFNSAAFTSDNFFLKKEFALEFLLRYRREIGKPFWCQMRVELVDAEVARLLREAGCHMVSVGIESGSERVRKQILNRHMSNEAIIRACSTLTQHGIEINAFNMIGIPGETFEEALETIRLNTMIGPASSWCSFFQPYPGSKLTAKLLEEGVITTEVFERIPASYFDKSIVLREDAHVWLNLQRLFQWWVRYPYLDKWFRRICNVRIPRIYDALFVLSFYSYVRRAYKLTRTKALAKVITNAWEALRARAS